MGGYANVADGNYSGVFSGRDNCVCTGSLYSLQMFGTQHRTQGNSCYAAILGGLAALHENDNYGFNGAPQHSYMTGNSCYNNLATGNYVSIYNSCYSSHMTMDNAGHGYVCCCQLFNNIYKTTNNFKISHPDPSKCETMDLWHTTVESPTVGDTLYRYDVNVINCSAQVQLPDYFKHLNECPQVWVTPNDGHGNAYGLVDSNLSVLDICADTDGCYSALVLATRKDELAIKSWDGFEEPKRTQLDIIR